MAGSKWVDHYIYIYAYIYIYMYYTDEYISDMFDVVLRCRVSILKSCMCTLRHVHKRKMCMERFKRRHLQHKYQLHYFISVTTFTTIEWCQPRIHKTLGCLVGRVPFQPFIIIYPYLGESPQLINQGS